ncbi:hypothetical protein GA0115254_118086 [Streptomyces sp. Ncost-T10-10d]|nr:hypothetical protein GA0115254_118086 [Streptomyces sp. Ncost-T10-10d]
MEPLSAPACSRSKRRDVLPPGSAPLGCTHDRALTILGYDGTQAQLWSAQRLRKANEAKSTLHAQPAASVRHGEHRILDDAGRSRLHGERKDIVAPGEQ